MGEGVRGGNHDDIVIVMFQYMYQSELKYV